MISAEEHARLRQVFGAGELPDDTVETIRSVKMDPRHNHLDDLIKDWTPRACRSRSPVSSFAMRIFGAPNIFAGRRKVRKTDLAPSCSRRSRSATIRMSLCCQ